MATYDETILSDLHKDAYGFRPSESFYYRWNSSTEAEKQAIWDGLLVALASEIAQEEAERAAAVARFEAQVAENIKLGAQDRETAIRWLVDSLELDEHDLAYGGDYVTYRLNLPYEMNRIFDGACREILAKRIAA